MKFTLIAFVALFASIGISSCDKIKDAIFQAFMTNSAALEFTIDVVTNTDAVGDIGSMSTTLNIDSIIKAESNNEFNINSITSINLEECKITVLNPDSTNNCANFEKGNLYLLTNANPTPIQICSGINPDEYSETWILPADKTINLKSYLTGTQLSYNLTAKARRVTTKKLDCKMEIKFKVN